MWRMLLNIHQVRIDKSWLIYRCPYTWSASSGYLLFPLISDDIFRLIDRRFTARVVRMMTFATLPQVIVSANFFFLSSLISYWLNNVALDILRQSDAPKAMYSSWFALPLTSHNGYTNWNFAAHFAKELEQWHANELEEEERSRSVYWWHWIHQRHLPRRHS